MHMFNPYRHGVSLSFRRNVQVQDAAGQVRGGGS